MRERDTDSYKHRLLARIRNGEARVAVVGLGYVGLPLAVAIAKSGLSVIGVDLNTDRVGALAGGRSGIMDVPDEEIQNLLASGKFQPTSTYTAVTQCDVAVIAVPTPVDSHNVPNLDFVKGAAQSLAGALPKGSLVVLESTTYPGTTEELLIPAFSQAGFTIDSEVFFGYSPERIDPGNSHWNFTNTPKIVSGLTEGDLELMLTFYGRFIRKLVPVSNLKTAEISKLFENAFRAVNIALVNEFQTICEAFGIDVWEVIDGCSTKPYGFMPFYPGPGLGGHCIPIDPLYLAWKAKAMGVTTDFIELSHKVNTRMPKLVVDRITHKLNDAGRPLRGSRIGLLGVSYKKNVGDMRESPAIPLIHLLLKSGCNVSYHDPHVAEASIGNGVRLQSQALSQEFLQKQDCIVVIADHDLIDWHMVSSCSRVVVDTRNVLRRKARPIASQSRSGLPTSNGHGSNIEPLVPYLTPKRGEPPTR